MEINSDKIAIIREWLVFFVFVGLSASSFIFVGNGYFYGIILGILAIYKCPNKNIQKWNEHQINSMKNLLSSSILLALILFVVIGGIWAMLKIIDGFNNVGKYEGRSAKEWYYEYVYAEDSYTKLKRCVDDYDSFDIQTQLDYGGVWYYCE